MICHSSQDVKQGIQYFIRNLCFLHLYYARVIATNWLSDSRFVSASRLQVILTMFLSYSLLSCIYFMLKVLHIVVLCLFDGN